MPDLAVAQRLGLGRCWPVPLCGRCVSQPTPAPHRRLTLDMVEKAARVAAQHGEHAKKTLGHDRRCALEAADRVPGGADAKQRAKQEVGAPGLTSHKS
jgi:hypothetical protein